MARTTQTPPVAAGGEADAASFELRLAERLLDDRALPTTSLPSQRDVASLVDEALALLLPRRHEGGARSIDEVVAGLARLRTEFERVVATVVATERAVELTSRFLELLPGIRDHLLADAEAIAAGDPAAESIAEVVAAYPGFLALTVHRLANGLLKLGVPIVPRLLAEVAHARTGIDIHPGATIGRSMSIDHGTGVVIGETAVIGDEVKIYQGVTLGALSVTKSAAGAKRHPTIEDRVVLYANATVLGGDTTIGHDSVIGGNVWLTASVPPFAYVHNVSEVRVRRVSDLHDPSDYSI